MDQVPHQKTPHEMQNQSTLPNDDLNVRMRCPTCRKLFSVPTQEIAEAEPKFSCNSCQTLFFISFREALETNDELQGVVYQEPSVELLDTAQAPMTAPIPLSSPTSAPAVAPASATALINEIFSCPKCGQAYKAGDEECSACGVLFFKLAEKTNKNFQRQQEEIFSTSPEVRQAWDDVLNAYENYESHRQFINAAWADRSLDYAAHKYGTILDVLPKDDMALRAVKEVHALVAVKFEVSVEEIETKGWRAVMRQVIMARAHVFSFRRMKLTNVIMVGCGVIIVMGLMLPHLRNLVGFGSAILGFILALRYYFRVI